VFSSNASLADMSTVLHIQSLLGTCRSVKGNPEMLIKIAADCFRLNGKEE